MEPCAVMVDALISTPSGPLVIPPASPGTEAPVFLSLVVPTFNESKNVPVLVDQLDALFRPVLGDRYEIIVVDDDSPDKTWQVAAELASTHPSVRVMRRVGERGLSTAVIRGWQAARGEVIGVMDADLQHPSEVNLALVREIQKGAALAVASRHVEGGGVSDWSMIRRILSRGAQLLGLLILPDVIGRLSDPMSGYFMLRRSAIAGKELDPLGYKILIEVVARGGIRWIGEVGYVFKERLSGESKVTWHLYTQYLLHLVKLRLAIGARFLRFVTVGASGVLVDMGLLYLLSDPHMLNLGLSRSKIIAAESAILTNFILNDLWTFRVESAGHGGFRARIRRFLGFNAICGAGLLLNLVLLNLMFNLLHINRYVANLLAIVIVTGWNYWLNTKLNWAPLQVGASAASADSPAEAPNGESGRSPR